MSPIITVDHLTKSFQIPQKEPGITGSLKSLFNRQYKEMTAVNHVSFAIDEGELVGFIGPNGAGKTTTLKMLSGLLYPTSGKVDVLGYTPFERKHPFLKQISLVMGQKNQLWWDLPAVDTFLLNKEIYEIPDEQYKTVVNELTQMFEVEDVLQTQVRKLSLGQRMKMELIAALLHSPKVMFLDEPTIGLDVVMQQNMREFIRSYNEKYHATILLTSHYMDDVKQLCKRVIIIDHGKIMYDGLLENIVRQFAPNKYITVTLEKEVPKEILSKFAPIALIDYPTVVFEVERSKATSLAAKLLEKLPVEDLNIEEPKIEDIIRDVFQSKTT